MSAGPIETNPLKSTLPQRVTALEAYAQFAKSGGNLGENSPLVKGWPFEKKPAESTPDFSRLPFPADVRESIQTRYEVAGKAKEEARALMMAEGVKVTD